MSALDQTLALDFAVREAVGAVGVHASQAGNHTAAQLAWEIVNALTPEQSAPLMTRGDALLTATIDWARSAQPDVVQKLEELIQTLKAGDHRILIGSIGYRVKDTGELDVQYERIRRSVLERTGR